MCVCVWGGGRGGGWEVGGWRSRENGTLGGKPEFASTMTGADPFRLNGHPWDSGTEPRKRPGEERQTFSHQVIDLNIKQSEVGHKLCSHYIFC